MAKKYEWQFWGETTDKSYARKWHSGRFGSKVISVRQHKILRAGTVGDLGLPSYTVWLKKWK